VTGAPRPVARGRTSPLELRVPPDLVALVVAAIMWLVSTATPSLDAPRAPRVAIAVALLIAGLALILAARIAFARAGTTFSPIAPERSRRLVTTGIYRFTRNPMYLGTLLALLALAASWSDPIAAIVALSYVVYIDRFQIRPEERVLRERFGAEYDGYAHAVRRWV
jgi:protein-S-isoprenylcysteine O-methyltransferase Ste14